jgi:xanthosine utilization system XapX-like protein
MRLFYKPFSIVFGLIGGLLAKKLFEVVWSWIDKEEPPDANVRETTWPKVLGAAAVEGVTFKVTRAAIDRAGAHSFERLTGVWPGPATTGE